MKKKNNKRIFLIVIFVLCSFVLYYGTKYTYTSYESAVDAKVNSKVAGINVSINGQNIVKSGIVTDIKKDDYSAVYTVEGKKSTVTVASARVLGKYSNTYAHLGRILNILESRIGFLFLVLLPIMIVFIYQLYEFIVILRYDEVDENEKVVNKKRKIQKDKSKKDDNIEVL